MTSLLITYIMVNLQLIISPSFLINVSLSDGSCHFASTFPLPVESANVLEKKKKAAHSQTSDMSFAIMFQSFRGVVLNKCPSQLIIANWTCVISHHTVVLFLHFWPWIHDFPGKLRKCEGV